MFAYTARSGIANPENTPQIALQLVADPDSGLYAKTFVPSRGIHTRVRARAVVLETRSGRFALVQVDLGGIPYALVQEVVERLGGTGLRPDRVMISATHTHSSTGPIWPGDSQGYAALGGDAFDARIFQLTAQGIAEAITQAAGRLQPARVGIATTSVTDASRNRSKDAFARNRDVPADPARRAAVSVNPDLTVIRVDSADGAPMAAWSNFAIHTTSFGDENLLFSGDNAAFAERITEAEIRRQSAARGTPARGEVVNVWTNSAEGDVSPNGDPDTAGRDGLEPEQKPVQEPQQPPKPQPAQFVPNSFAKAHLAGLRTARGILRAWRQAGRHMRGDLALDSRRVFVRFDGTRAEGEPVGPVAVLGFGGIAGPDGTCAPVDNFAGPGQGEKFPSLAGAGLVPDTGPVSVWRVGDLGLAAFPSEITKQMGLRINDAVRAASGGRLKRVALVGLTDGYQSYTATPEEYGGCFYEGSFTLWGRRQGPRFRDTAAPLAASLFGGTAPASAPAPPNLVPPAGAGPPAGQTPDAGRPVEQPAAVTPRFGRAQFRWQGGNPQVDAPRGRTFVTIERRARGRWSRVATDDSFLDTTERDDSDVWTERFQLDACAPTGAHRFVVTGIADRGGGPEPYRIVSRTFTVRPSTDLRAGRAVVRGRRAHVAATYPDPGKAALLAFPVRVRSGSVLLSVKPRRGRSFRVRATPDPRHPRFVARVPEGSRVSVLGVRDRCGNTGR